MPSSDRKARLSAPMCARISSIDKRRRDQVAVVAHVDTEVAGVGDRRARDLQMDLGGSGVAHELHERPGGRAAHQRVVDHHHPLAFEVLAQGVELQRHAALADVLRRLDERAPDVAVLDQPVVEADAALGRVADGGGDRAVGHRDHDVGVGRRLAGEFDTELLAHVVDAAVRATPSRAWRSTRTRTSSGRRGVAGRAPGRGRSRRRAA